MESVDWPYAALETSPTICSSEAYRTPSQSHWLGLRVPNSTRKAPPLSGVSITVTAVPAASTRPFVAKASCTQVNKPDNDDESILDPVDGDDDATLL